MHDMFKRYGTGLTTMILLVTAFWILILLILPNLTMFESSFRPYLPVTEVGGPRDVYSFANYGRILGAHTDLSVLGITFEVPVRVKVFILTIYYSAVVTLITFALAYPLAYYLAKIVSPKSLPTLFLLLFVPLWVSEILRSFAWFIILAFKGPLNVALMSLGIIDSEIRWIAGFSPVIIGLVYTYVLFMLFPLYNSMQSLDSNQIEAAEDLGSPWWRTHWRVILPHAKPGIASGAVMVFMLSAGSLLVPSLLGSTTSGWFTQTIQGVMLEEADWNTGAAFAFLLLIVCTLFVSLMMRVFGVRLSDIAK
ncbi:MAG: ABC transporter permease [Tabrizicola sp.]|uniref:ABC transporter permease n=1 Tax=Tabrizicola sp. TaxID=2005166 RepID=UPI0027374D29|nr:ABC transporter permease [Tabrizicola sp.]MDP3262850.1 ABC transporter permease [Tabrizicola sp.]MDP3649047.1 ABC transporter permease [Paracoccaceae bacterium]MDZ4065893.1 ABC transporter permease [Tabrizicola sp.]